MEAGLRPDELYRTLYQTDRPQRLRLMARMLESLQLHLGQRLGAAPPLVGGHVRLGGQGPQEAAPAQQRLQAQH